MKNISLFLFLLAFKAQAADDSLLAVVLMVKNEAPAIVETLQPFVKGGVKRFLVFDTGSTDGTQNIIRDYFKKEGLTHAYVLEEPFINFATSRNHALTSAENLFPETTFMIMPDAEWYIHNVEGLLEFCAQEKPNSHSCYFLQERSPNVNGIETMTLAVPRLMRANAHVRFVGPVHEIPDHIPTISVPSTTYVTHQPCAQGREKTSQRFHRDITLLLKELEKNPTDPRTLFYLAQTYECLNDWENAYIYYKKRADVGGWNEENFMTYLRLGDVAQKLFPKEKENLPLLPAVKHCPQTFALQSFLQHRNQTLYPIAVGHYLEAYASRPERAESLIRIARYYLDLNQMPLAFLFAAQAARIPYPDRDILFVEKEKYTYTRYDTLGIAAWYVQEYELGEWAVRKALEALPDAPHLQHNLKLYCDRKNIKQ